MLMPSYLPKYNFSQQMIAIVYKARCPCGISPWHGSVQKTFM